MVKFIHKSIYLKYLSCTKNAWLKLHKQDEIEVYFALSESDQAIVKKGNLVELVARRLFPDGILIDNHTNEAAASCTKLYVNQKKPVLFQATFITDCFLVKTDVLKYNPESGKWWLYEIKGKNSIEEKKDEIDHIEDATFQAIVLQDQGIELEGIFLIHLSKNYVRQGDINISELFTIANITEKVKEREYKTRTKMQKAKDDLLQYAKGSLICNCIYKGRNSHCETFCYSYPDVPEYAVHNIARIGSKKLNSLIDANIFNLEDIPDSFELTSIQKNQVNTYKFKETLVDSSRIKQEIEKLQYPLYFLDYESYSHPVPLFDGLKPYQQLSFQFSLFVLHDPYTEPIHFEYLHESESDPSKFIITKLKELIGPKGNVIVWHKSFEQKINKELAERHPDFRTFLQDLNDRIFDLEEIFTKQYYVEAGFKGSTSIKNVLPVLAPDCSYDELDIKDGGVASEKWYSMIHLNLNNAEKDKISEDLKRYCKLDTYGMYKIWLYLFKNVLKTNVVHSNYSNVEKTI